MPIPEQKSSIPLHYQKYCNNPELEIYSCDFLIHLDCPSTCMLARKLSQGITHTAKTGLERFIEKYGKNWRLIAFGEQCPIIPNIADEIEGEYKE